MTAMDTSLLTKITIDINKSFGSKCVFYFLSNLIYELALNMYLMCTNSGMPVITYIWPVITCFKFGLHVN